MKTKTFIFYTLDEERPLLGQPVLVELNNNDDMKYYVCTLEECRNGLWHSERMGKGSGCQRRDVNE